MPRKVPDNCTACDGTGKHGWKEEKTGSEVVQQLSEDDQKILVSDLANSRDIYFTVDGIQWKFTSTSYHSETRGKG